MKIVSVSVCVVEKGEKGRGFSHLKAMNKPEAGYLWGSMICNTFEEDDDQVLLLLVCVLELREIEE